MPLFRHTLAQVCAPPWLALWALQACALSHQVGADPGEEAGKEAGAESARASCDLHRAHLDISISTAPGSVEECVPGPVDGWVTGPIIDEDGVTEFRLDTCPPHDTCDASRVCSIRIAGHDVALRTTIDDRELRMFGWVEPGFAQLSYDRGDCLTCDRTILFAYEGGPVPDPGELVFDEGPALCDEEVCGDRPYALTASAPAPAPATVTVVPGETAWLGERLRVRLLSYIQDPCSDEPGTAAWIVWEQLSP